MIRSNKFQQPIHFLIWLTTCGLLLLWAAPTWAAPDHRIFAGLLTRYNHNGVVDYAGFKKEEAHLDAYLEALAQIKSESLPRNERFALYANAYNAWTIKLILSGYPGLESIKDLGSLFKSPWKKKLVRLDGKRLTLDAVEHDILRPQFKDPRVHMAVNCASKGCPPLWGEPFTGSRLDEQLDAAATAFINNPAFNRIEGDTLYASRIFKWFGEDFNHDIIGFVAQYATGDLKNAIESRRLSLRIKYLDYDWSLNGR